MRNFTIRQSATELPLPNSTKYKGGEILRLFHLLDTNECLWYNLCMNEIRKQRTVLHSDANAFYASVETALDPRLKGKAVAVCGSVEKRHGIVLAKSEKAKTCGIKTGMANWEAKRLCPDLIIVPPRHEVYAAFSLALHEIYERYTDLVEPFGLDECWLDVTNNLKNPREIADEIRETVKRELGITVSVGISFNKVFAKLGSDLKKPDAVTEITQENFRDLVWELPCSDLLYCGRATTARLKEFGIRTIGDLARFPCDYLKKTLGKNGETLWRYANGLDESEVARFDAYEKAKSVGHGITCVADLQNEEEVRAVIVALSQDVGRRLRKAKLRANGVQVTVRDNGLEFHSWQKQLSAPTQESATVAEACSQLFKDRYGWQKPVRAVSVTAISLEDENAPYQPSLLLENKIGEKRKKVERALDGICEKFGKKAITPAVLLCDNKLPEDMKEGVVLPGKHV